MGIIQRKQQTVKILELGGAIAILFMMVGIATHPNFAMNEDLGRHLKLGQIIWETHSVPTVNLFTYTNPNFPFINHHWFGEVIFYLLNQWAGLSAISLIKIIVISFSVLIAFLLAKKIAGILPAILSAIIIAPIITNRTDERPEFFGFLLFSLMLWILFSKEKPDKKYLICIPFLLFIWVNIHLSFIYGLFLLVVFLFKNFWLFLKNKIVKNELIFYWLISVLSALLLFINPNGLRGVLYPFKIFANYGYMIIENQDIFFLFTRIPNGLIIYFLVVAPIIILTIIGSIIFSVKNRVKNNFTPYALYFVSLVFTALSFLALRNFPFFVLSAIPAFALAISLFIEKWLKKKETQTAFSLCLIIIGLVLAGFLFLKPTFSLGTALNYKNGVDFFLANKLPGNIFNNFDIGGYLDYRLYPQYKTFIDNRPEAFPEEFFEKYRSIQTDAEIRKQEFAKYNINSIIFSHRDITPWAQEFLKQMTQNSEWKAVYFDPAMVIFVKQNYPLQDIGPLYLELRN